FVGASPIAVFEVDQDGTILEVNPAAENLFGLSVTESLGRSLPRTLIPDDEPTLNHAWWKDYVARHEPISGLRARVLRRDGIELIVDFSLTPLISHSGELLSIIVQGRDVTQQLESERLKKEFTSTLSHELRTPLTSIIGSLQLVNTGVMGDVDAELIELTQIAERNAERLLDLINDLLDIEKIESGKFTIYPEVLSLDELVKEALVLNGGFAERYQVRLQVLGTLPAVKVSADRKRALQVMTNLISNAAKFSPEGSTVDVSMDISNGVARVNVHDRGPGIPESFRGRIFGRFAQADMTATRHKGGSGLGLAICKRLIEMMAGRIGFDDREGGGTTFWFELDIIE
ncbi:MAG: sensor histidine kinase, partial [Burkholderiales bacterium]